MASRLLRLVVVIAVAGVLLAVSTVVVAPQIGAFITAGEVEPPEIDLDPLAERSLAFSEDGSVLATFHAEENRQELPLDEIPEAVKATILTVEDEDVNLHYVHVNRERKGRSCRACHDVHAGDNRKLIRESVPFGRGGYRLAIGHEPTAEGGRCATGCHEAEEYTRNRSED